MDMSKGTIQYDKGMSCSGAIMKDADVSIISLLKVLLWPQMQSSSQHSYTCGDVAYQVAYVEEMIESEAFCRILRSSHKSIGSTNARIGSSLSKIHQI